MAGHLELPPLPTGAEPLNQEDQPAEYAEVLCSPESSSLPGAGSMPDSGGNLEQPEADRVVTNIPSIVSEQLFIENENYNESGSNGSGASRIQEVQWPRPEPLIYHTEAGAISGSLLKRVRGRLRPSEHKRKSMLSENDSRVN